MPPSPLTAYIGTRILIGLGIPGGSSRPVSKPLVSCRLTVVRGRRCDASQYCSRGQENRSVIGASPLGPGNKSLFHGQCHEGRPCYIQVHRCHEGRPCYIQVLCKCIPQQNINGPFYARYLSSTGLFNQTTIDNLSAYNNNNDCHYDMLIFSCIAGTTQQHCTLKIIFWKHPVKVLCTKRAIMFLSASDTNCWLGGMICRIQSLISLV